jgi:hypothetical protein
LFSSFFLSSNLFHFYFIFKADIDIRYWDPNRGGGENGTEGHFTQGNKVKGRALRLRYLRSIYEDMTWIDPMRPPEQEESKIIQKVRGRTAATCGDSVRGSNREIGNVPRRDDDGVQGRAPPREEGDTVGRLIESQDDDNNESNDDGDNNNYEMTELQQRILRRAMENLGSIRKKIPKNAHPSKARDETVREMRERMVAENNAKKSEGQADREKTDELASRRKANTIFNLRLKADKRRCRLASISPIPDTPETSSKCIESSLKRNTIGIEAADASQYAMKPWEPSLSYSSPRGWGKAYVDNAAEGRSRTTPEHQFDYKVSSPGLFFTPVPPS